MGKIKIGEKLPFLNICPFRVPCQILDVDFAATLKELIGNIVLVGSANLLGAPAYDYRDQYCVLMAESGHQSLFNLNTRSVQMSRRGRGLFCIPQNLFNAPPFPHDSVEQSGARLLFQLKMSEGNISFSHVSISMFREELY